MASTAKTNTMPTTMSIGSACHSAGVGKSRQAPAIWRKRITGTRLEVGLYVVLVVSLAIGALILSDLVLGVGAGIAALALVGALSARRRELTKDDETGS